MPASVRPFTSDGGWLAPNGAFWQCEDFEHHHCARTVVIDLGIEMTDYSAERTLETAGFVHLSLGRAYFVGRELTQAQCDVLFDMVTRFPETWGHGSDRHGILALLRSPEVHELITPYSSF